MEDIKSRLEFMLCGKWYDPYLRKLAIYDHLVECKLKYEAYKLHSINTQFSKEDLEKELDKELVDLYILLSLHYKNRPELIRERISVFLEKMGG